MAKHSSEDGRVGGGFGPDTIEGGIRERVREVIQAIVNEELEAGSRHATELWRARKEEDASNARQVGEVDFSRSESERHRHAMSEVRVPKCIYALKDPNNLGIVTSRGVRNDVRNDLAKGVIGPVVLDLSDTLHRVKRIATCFPISPGDIVVRGVRGVEQRESRGVLRGAQLLDCRRKHGLDRGRQDTSKVAVLVEIPGDTVRGEDRIHAVPVFGEGAGRLKIWNQTKNDIVDPPPFSRSQEPGRLSAPRAHRIARGLDTKGVSDSLVELGLSRVAFVVLGDRECNVDELIPHRRRGSVVDRSGWLRVVRTAGKIVRSHARWSFLRCYARPFARSASRPVAIIL